MKIIEIYFVSLFIELTQIVPVCWVCAFNTERPCNMITVTKLSRPLSLYRLCFIKSNALAVQLELQGMHLG